MNAYVLALGILHAHRVLAVPKGVLRTLACLAYRSYVRMRALDALEAADAL